MVAKVEMARIENSEHLELEVAFHGSAALVATLWRCIMASRKPVKERCQEGKNNRVKRACRCENKMPTEKPQRRGLHSPQGEGPGLAWILRNELQGDRGIALVDFGILYSPGECLLGHSLPVNNQLSNAPCSDAYVIVDGWRWEGHSSSRVQGAGDMQQRRKAFAAILS